MFVGFRAPSGGWEERGCRASKTGSSAAGPSKIRFNNWAHTATRLWISEIMSERIQAALVI
jgi:hypothetical protein